jgi:hypothetical protein
VEQWISNDFSITAIVGPAGVLLGPCYVNCGAEVPLVLPCVFECTVHRREGQVHALPAKGNCVGDYTLYCVVYLQGEVLSCFNLSVNNAVDLIGYLLSDFRVFGLS